MSDKKTLVQSSSLLGVSGLSGKTVSTIAAYQHGSTLVIEIVASDSTTTFIKHRQGLVEVGGSNEFGTGTRVL